MSPERLWCRTTWWPVQAFPGPAWEPDRTFSTQRSGLLPSNGSETGVTGAKDVRNLCLVADGAGESGGADAAALFVADDDLVAGQGASAVQAGGDRGDVSAGGGAVVGRVDLDAEGDAA